MGFPGDSDNKESTCSARDLGSIPGLGRFPGEGKSACNVGDLGLNPELGRSPGEGNDYPLQNSCLENSMDRGAGRAQSMGSQRVRHD